MASKARKAFDENLEDIEHLLDFYRTAELLFREEPVGELPENVDVVLRSAVVMLVTYWEAYVEDITAEAVSHISRKIQAPDSLPKDLKKAILKELNSEKNDLAMWGLTGDGWRTVLVSRLEAMRVARNRSFNTPKAQATKDFIASAIGVPDITQSWEVKGNSSKEVCDLLDALIELRGKIAHRGRIDEEITVKSVDDLKSFVQSLVSKTGGKINVTLMELTGIPLWEKKLKKRPS